MKDFLQFLDASPVSALAVEEVKKELLLHGFQELDAGSPFVLQAGGCYFVQNKLTDLVAFRLPDTMNDETLSFRLLGAHTDSPCFRIKPGGEIKSAGIRRLDVETYGGPIYSTWMDRPLSLAGTVALRSDNPLKPISAVVDLEEPFLTIPNLAIHMNRDVNSGVALNPQNDMLPLIGLDTENATTLLDRLSQKLHVEKEDIIDFDLYTYVCEQACLLGADQELISANRLDDLIMVHTGLKAFRQASSASCIQTLVLFDNEEIGSRTVAGADSQWLSQILERILLSFNKNRADFLCAIEKSFSISADVAHAQHPAHLEKADTNVPTHLGKGPVLKLSAGGSYVTRSEDYAVFDEVCRLSRVPMQKFVNRSDMRGGSTIGPLLASHLPMRSLDMGIAILAMHSARELASVKDYEYTVKAFTKYFEV